MNRHERRTNPDQWWQVVGYAKSEREVGVQNGDPVYVRGDASELPVVSLPESVGKMDSAGLAQYMQSVQAALEAAGIKNALIMPAHIKFVCLRPVSPETSRALSQRSRGDRVVVPRRPQKPRSTN